MKKLISVSVILAAVFAGSTAWSYTQIFCQKGLEAPSGYCRAVQLNVNNGQGFFSYSNGIWIMGPDSEVKKVYSGGKGQWSAEYSESKLCTKETPQFDNSSGGGGPPCAKGQKPSFK